MTANALFNRIKAKRSFLCVGLDSDIAKLPQHLLKTDKPVLEFNRAIIDATAPYAVCYKPNLAFYESRGAEGLTDFEDTCRYIREHYPDILIIADAKRGDIGNTAEQYAKAFFGGDLVDGITLSPYMGFDSILPFMKYEGKWSIILGLTSNAGADDFEMQRMATGEKLFERVLRTAKEWGSEDNTMFVVGATKAFMLEDIREIVPDHFLLVPGVGAQGGSLHDVAAYGMNSRCGLLVNSSRGIIFADSTERFAEVAAEKAKAMQVEMDGLLKMYL